MNAISTQSGATQGSLFGGIAAALVAGILLVGVSGFAQAHALHDAAHDVRHASGFPCH